MTRNGTWNFCDVSNLKIAFFSGFFSLATCGSPVAPALENKLKWDALKSFEAIQSSSIFKAQVLVRFSTGSEEFSTGSETKIFKTSFESECSSVTVGIIRKNVKVTVNVFELPE